ncbi:MULTISPECIES: SDR family oxidoreductase [Exiguobacterium]|uniref:SDR family oxidoreductase n=1 Tax=Exiguobacterium TaxID=33986 RepID=UPI001BE84B2D|nr:MULTISPECIES: SDR family NAD(P)-dependent oxidoreductase [Exiguobacterium]MCT4783626.1 SDR family oxidoreductase [Exiguobacterium himgiriensis]
MISNTLLSGKVAFVTGAASGIGRAAVIRFVQAGAKVAIVDLKLEDAEQLASLIGEERAIGISADVANEEEMKRAYEQTMERFGRLDIVFANAGRNGTITPIEHLSLEDWNSVVETNLTGTFLTVKYAIPHLKDQGGSVILTSSINGNRYFKNFGFSGYATTKAGQTGFAKMAAAELAQFGIRVNSICPGAIDTNIDDSTNRDDALLEEVVIPIEYPEGNQPLAGKSGSAKQVADVVLFFASSMSSHVTGSEVYVDGAESLL